MKEEWTIGTALALLAVALGCVISSHLGRHDLAEAFYGAAKALTVAAVIFAGWALWEYLER